ncbi:hypothetical protein FRC18_005562 [Serendipita sp. 400]|nr:hypothetical protein FRC18_005562 [Serendipita sp. 400]
MFRSRVPSIGAIFRYPTSSWFRTSSQSKQVPHMQTSYTSRDVEVDRDFLITTPPDAKPILTYPIEFEDTILPEYEGLYAVVLDHVLSPSECAQLIKYAELSAGAGEPDAKAVKKKKRRGSDSTSENVDENGWKPALVNIGRGREVMISNYRDSDRIIWDNQEVIDRIWDRCLNGGEESVVRERLQTLANDPLVQGNSAFNAGNRWRMKRLNERMRFLRYGKGQFFKEHCDGSYTTPNGAETSFVTMHLYLNDSIQAITPPSVLSPTSISFPTPIPNPEAGKPELEGGATPFHSGNMKRRIDVDPKAGRVLLFQHRNLLHSGDYVTAGIKYTMRTDLMYEAIDIGTD